MSKTSQFKIFKRSKVVGRATYYIVDESDNSIVFETNDPAKAEEQLKKLQPKLPVTSTLNA